MSSYMHMNALSCVYTFPRPSQGRLYVPNGEGKAFSEGIFLYMYVSPQGYILVFKLSSRRPVFSILVSLLDHVKLGVFGLAPRKGFSNQTVYNAGKCPFTRLGGWQEFSMKGSSCPLSPWKRAEGAVVFPAPSVSVPVPNLCLP